MIGVKEINYRKFLTKNKDDRKIKMFSLLFKISAGYDYPPNECNGRSSFPGNIKYYVQDYDGKANDYQYHVKKYHFTPGNKYDYNWLSGSFCPKQTGTATLTLYGFPTLYYKFVDSFPYKSYSDYCVTGVTEKITQMFYANRCYPLAMASYTHCGDELKASLNDTIISSESVTLLDCYLTDCLEGYYSDTCEFHVDADCNGNGTPEDGRKSNGLGCICNRFNDNIFCEDTSKNKFNKPGVTFKSYYNASKVDVTEHLNSFAFKEFGESYSTIELSTNLYVPQNTFLEFQLTTVPNAELYIGGEKVAGYFDQTFNCEEKNPYIYNIPKKWYKKGIYPIKIVMQSGCAIYKQGIGLKWKFHRWYKNNPPGFEEIPTRYLGEN